MTPIICTAERMNYEINSGLGKLLTNENRSAVGFERRYSITDPLGIHGETKAGG